MKERIIPNEFPNVYVHVINMDTCIHECIRHTPTDDYVVFINARISHEAQMAAYKHALRHIKNHDFEKSDVQEIEFQAHRDSL